MSEQARAIVVRNRRVVGARHMTCGAIVHCPRRETSVATTECLACGHCRGFVSHAAGTSMLCARPSIDESAIEELVRGRLFAPGNENTTLSELMTSDVICVAPELPLSELMHLMVEFEIGGAPVIDESGELVGVVSRSDLVDRFAAGATVADIVRPIELVLPESATVSRAAALMTRARINRIPVVAADGRVVGMVSSVDVDRWLAGRNQRSLAGDQG